MKLSEAEHTMPRYLKAAHLLTIALILLPLVVGSFFAFPVWDDGWLLLLVREHGVNAVVLTYPDRPLVGYLMRAIVPAGPGFWWLALLTQAASWVALGVITSLLWTRLFPGLRRYAIAVACLTIAPIVVNATVQQCLVTVTLICVLPATLGYGCLLLLLRFVAAGDRIGKAAITIGLVLLACGVLITEYVLPVEIVIVTLLLHQAYVYRRSDKGFRAATAIVLSAVTTGIAYLIFLVWSQNFVTRPNAFPLNVGLYSHSYLTFPRIIASSLWRLIVGAYGSSLNAIGDLSDKRAVAALAYGALVAALLVYCCWRRTDESASSKSASNSGKGFVLLFALILSLIPAILMGRAPYPPSRFVIPSIPIAVMLTVLLSVNLSRRRFWFVPIALMGLVAGNAAFKEAWTSVHRQQAFSQVGAALESDVLSNNGFNVAIVSKPGPDYELTAKVSAKWPVDLGKRLWVYTEKRALPIFGERNRCINEDAIDRELRLVERKGPIDLLVWVDMKVDGSFTVEPYCFRETADVPR